MVDCKDRLCDLGHEGCIHPDYEAHVKNEKIQVMNTLSAGEHARWKIQNDYIRQHYKHILESNAVLVVNLEKRGIKNYIGGNVLMEMGMAYVNDKKVFLLNDIPAEEIPYLDEIIALSPICLNGRLEDI
jgi:hypothetical protein